MIKINSMTQNNHNKNIKHTNGSHSGDTNNTEECFCLNQSEGEKRYCRCGHNLDIEGCFMCFPVKEVAVKSSPSSTETAKEHGYRESGITEYTKEGWIERFEDYINCETMLDWRIAKGLIPFVRSEIEKARSEGYDEGTDKGYFQGREDGRNEGYEKGLDIGNKTKEIAINNLITDVNTARIEARNSAIDECIAALTKEWPKISEAESSYQTQELGNVQCVLLALKK
jgi:hypothetical protein